MDLASPIVHKSGDSLHVTHGDDSQVFAEFYMNSVYLEGKSKEAGHPIYKDIPFIRMTFPKDMTKRIDRPAVIESDGINPTDIERFPKAWEIFQRQNEEVSEGTPLVHWAPLSRSDALTYKGLKIHTVEQLANIPDSNLHNYPLGARQFRDQAIAWLKQAEGGKEVVKLQAENESLRADMEILRKQFSDLSKKLEKQKG